MLALLAIGEDKHLHSIFRITTYMTCNCTLILGDVTPYHRYISAIDGVVEELLCQVCVGALILSYNEQSRCILVDTKHQASPGVPLAKHLQILEVV